ncbi:MAG: hypothetical protein HY010_15475 [Acidobacteria bacterium]|nr:hypothetical protein [Acidobacteriota bacterium]
MSGENDKILHEVRLGLMQAKIASKREEARERRREEEMRTELELMLDDLTQNDVDLNSPEGMAIAVKCWAVKMARRRGADSGGLTNGEIFLR